jgi:outer membrane receptor protein involved in Fe transport/Tfp pilus assembly protein PilF
LNLFPKAGRGLLLAVIFGGFLACVEGSWAQPMAGGGATNEIRIVELQGTAEVAPAAATTWAPVQTNRILHPFDRLRTGANSRMALLWTDRSVVSFGALTELEILPPDSADAQCGLHLLRGIVSFFHRDEPGRIRVITRGAVAGVEGTEFVLAVEPGKDTELATMSVIDGKVRFGNEQATLLLTNGQQAVVEPGKAPVRTAGFIANNVLQWCFYYPAVIDPADLPFTPEEQRILVESLQAYRSGDLQVALAKYPAGRQPGSDAERVYYAGLLLGVGQVEPAETVLASLSAADASSRPQRVARALRRLISAVKRQPNPAVTRPQLATEFLADSYYEQSRAIPGISLPAALDSARRAVTNSPDFGFVWERVAELEFSYGHTDRALDALDKSLVLSPRNAQALALKGFLLAAQNHTGEAIGWFNQALAVDSALGNAWLGRGLCRIHRGDSKGGREDLLVAAALEPQRAGLRSYLGKAYADAGDYPHAARELQLAKKLDPNDPTAWLYSALLNQQNNRINDAIGDLEKSQELNDNRSVYRSQLLLDQDQAVRSANLAAMYRDDGMFDVAVREASRAVNYDYANYSAHLFLANSYIELSDPNEINLRYETPAESEYLVANLLAPASAGVLSPTISQQEYSPLFNRDRIGIASSTEYLSRGAWTESGAQFGTFGNFSYDFEAFYRSDPGQSVNNDIEQQQYSLTVKQQLTPQDSVYVNGQLYYANSGDLAEFYNQNSASPTYRSNEQQEPNVSLGYNHEWSPGVHTLLFVARLDDTYSFTNFTQPSYFLTFVPTLISAQQMTTSEHFEDRLNIYSGELQQIWEGPEHTTIVGARIQYGHFDTAVLQANPEPVAYAFLVPPPEQDFTSLFKRISVYGYHQWQIFEPLQLIGGVTYDHITYPEDFRSAPISGNETTADQVSPKAGFIWTPLDKTTVRFAYTRSLAGASVDQSYQIEPSQVAGFIQNYHSIIPESVEGDNAGAKFETYDLSLEQKFSTGTYLGISGEILNSTVNRVDGAFDYYPLSLPNPRASGVSENLNYQEESLLVTANQLLGRDWSLGARYLLTQAVLNDSFPGVPVSPSAISNPIIPRQRTEGVLQQLSLSAIYNNPCGFFAQGEAQWYAQNNNGYTPSEGADFWQFNAYIGYRFLQRRAEVTLGLLNITDQNYNLNPLNLYNELPRSRTLVVSLQMHF